jgi:hypothetical protein
MRMLSLLSSLLVVGHAAVTGFAVPRSEPAWKPNPDYRGRSQILQAEPPDAVARAGTLLALSRLRVSATDEQRG